MHNKMVAKRHFLFLAVFFSGFLPGIFGDDTLLGLEIAKNKQNAAYIIYENKPIFAYGASPQNILTFLPYGRGNDFADWLHWAKRFGVKHVRSYPPVVVVPSTSENIFILSSSESSLFDLNKFNYRYFEELRNACLQLKENGIIVHLQLWQAVAWKKAWHKCYYNPKNNMNPDISEHAGPGEFVTMENPLLLAHQKKYVRKILDATGDLGNVFYDIMNEIGNGTGTSEEWVLEIIKTVKQWEKENNIDVLLTLNDEGGRRMGSFSLTCKGLDLIVKDLGRHDEHIEAKALYNKPTISVRNIDYDYETGKRFWFFGKNNLEVTTDEKLQTRGRKYWWRMFMSGVQSAGGYADAVAVDFPLWEKAINKLFARLSGEKIFHPEILATYRFNDISEYNFVHFRKFIDGIVNYEELVPDSTVQFDHPSQHQYCLQSKNQAIFYLESPNGNAGFHYAAYTAVIKGMLLEDGKYKALFYTPSSGQSQPFQVDIKNGEGVVDVPEFFDDIAIAIN